MAISSSSLFKAFRPPQPLHLALSVGVPLGYGLALQILLQPGQAPDLPLNVFLLGFVLAASLWTLRLARHRHTFWTRLRGLAVGAVAAWLLASLYSALWLEGGWEPSVDKALLTVLFCLYGLSGSFWQGRLASRARLYALLGRKTGEALRQGMRDYHEDAKFTPWQLQSLQGWLVVASLAVVVTATVNWSNYPQSGLILALVGAILVLHQVLSGQLRHFRAEMDLLAHGHRPGLAGKLARLGLLGLLALACLAAALVFANDAAYFPAHPEAEDPAAAEPLPAQTGILAEPSPARQTDFADRLKRILVLDYIDLAKLAAAIGRFMDLLGALVPWAVAAFILWPVGRSLWTNRFNVWLYWMDLKAFSLRLARLWGQFWRRKPADPHSEGLEHLSNAELWLSQLTGQTRRKITFKDYPFLVRQVLRLLQWGDRVGVRYRAGSPLSEYLHEAGERYPEAGAELAAISAALDQGFFAPGGLSHHQRQQLRQGIDGITGRRRFRPRPAITATPAAGS